MTIAPLWRRAALPLAGLVIGVVVAGAVLRRTTAPTPRTQSPIRFQIPPPGASAAEQFTLSADGTHLAFIANAGGPNQLWVRAMEELGARWLPGTDGGTYPFCSPNGSSIGFFAQGKLKKVASTGGPSQILCDVTDGRGGTWSRDDVILFSAAPGRRIRPQRGRVAPACAVERRLRGRACCRGCPGFHARARLTACLLRGFSGWRDYPPRARPAWSLPRRNKTEDAVPERPHQAFSSSGFLRSCECGAVPTTGGGVKFVDNPIAAGSD